jgi:signal transduction histidine kinase
LTLDKQQYALKYGLLYSAIIAVVLIVPFFVYISLMININETKSKIEMKKKSYEILQKMQAYQGTDEDYFTFPRYNRYRGGLFDTNLRPIFSLLKDLPLSFEPGYHEDQQRRYYVLPLPDGRYFGAKYLILEGEINNYEIYRMALLVALSILVLLFILSYFVFKNFALPFEKVNRQLDNFIKDSMHEINTPLSIINVNIDMFAHKFGENKYLTRIKAASKTLATIYNDMDYLIKQDRFGFEKESLDMSAFIEERVAYFQDVASLRQIEIKTDIEKDITLYFNATQLQRIVDNTLSNAIKYSRERSQVYVNLHLHKKRILFCVEDFGEGIEKPWKIFERYYRENLNKGGFGIGLNIVKRIIDEHDVTLEIVSEPGKGSAFCYSFGIA